MLIRAFITHKKAEFFSDCQDRFSISTDTKSIALSDGMSQSIFQKFWAEILVEQYTSILDWHPDLSSVRERSSKWRDRVNEYVEQLKKEGRQTWRVERNLSDGYSAGATFLGVRFDDCNWKCEVLGDSCLVLIRNNQIKRIVSSGSSSDGTISFNNYPDYFDSNPLKKGKGNLHREEGSLVKGDAMLLVSDPFSDFLLREKGTDKEESIIERLLTISSHEEYEVLVEEYRHDGMHNDDSTLIVIMPDGSCELNIEFEDQIVQMIKDEKATLNSTIFEKPHSISNITSVDPKEEIVKDNSNEYVKSKNAIQKENKYSTKIDVNQIFDSELDNNIQVRVFCSLRKYTDELSKKKLKEITKEITSEVIFMIHKTLKRK